MGFIFGGGGGGSVPSTTVNQQPQAGTGQFYQPQQQPQADAAYLSLLYNLENAYNTGGTPSQQIYPQALQQGQYAANIASPTGPLSYAANQIVGNPYYGQATDAALTSAGYVNSSFLPLAGMNADAASNALWGQQNAANAIAAQAPFSSGLAQNTAGLGANIPGYAGSTAALAPYLTGLSSQVAGGLQPTQGLAGQVSSTLPQYQQLANQAGGLFPQSQALTGGIAGNIPGIQGLSAQIAALMNPVTGIAAGVAPNAGAVNQLAGQPTGAPQLQQAAGNFYGLGNQLAGQPTGAGAAQSAGMGVGALGSQLAGQPTGAGSLQSGAASLLNTAFDPQSALYNRTVGELLDQKSAVNAMSGVGTSPYGAGVTDQALSNFNIDWQNNLLNRQATGLGAAGGALGQVQGLNQGQLGLANTGLQGLLSGLSGAQGLNAGQLGLANTALGGLGSGLAGAQGLNLGQGNLYGQGANLGGLQANILGQAAGIGGQGIGGLQAAAGVGGQAIGGLQAGGGIQQQIANILSGQGGQAATAGGLYGQAGGIGGQAGNLATGAGNLYGAATGQLGAGAGINTAASNQQAQSAAQNALASGIYGQLPGTAAASTQGIGALAQLLAASGGLPASTYGGQQQTNFNALNALGQAAGQAVNPLTGAANIGQAQYQLPQTLLSDLSNYLNLGQNASLAGATLGQIGTQNATNALSAIGSGLSGAGLGGTLFGSQGLTGALGLNPSTGLLGGLLGGGATSVADQSLLDTFAASPFASFSLFG